MTKHSIPIDFDLFEKVMVYNALTDALYLESIIEHVKPSYFKNKNIQAVFESLCQYFLTYNKTPNLTELKTHMTDPEKREALKKVALSFSDIDKTYDKDVLIKNTERFLKEKAVYSTVIRTNVEVQSGNINTQKILEDFEDACSISLVQNMGFDYFENIEKHCDELLKVSKCISTGWRWLDEHIGGGFAADGRALYVFYGKTNVGKSIFLGNVVTNILNQNKTVLLLTLEMSEQMYAKRISSQLSRVPNGELQNNIDPLKKELNAYKVKKNKAKLIIKEFPPQTVTAFQLKVFIDKLIKKGIKPNAIVLDYLNLVAPFEKGQNSYEAIKKITEQVRAMSYTFECPVITATQTNRSGYDNTNPGLETTSESMGLAMTADAQFSIWQAEDDKETGVIRLHIAKNRFGPAEVGTTLEIDYPTFTLTDQSNGASYAGSSGSSNKQQKHVLADTLNAIESLNEGDDI